jgi:hypothetical protein
MMAKKPKIAAAAMSAGSSAGIGPTLTGKMIEDAMGKAHLDALAKGVVDDAKILKLKLVRLRLALPASGIRPTATASRRLRT